MTKPEVIDIATARLPAHNRPRKRGGGPGGPDDMEQRVANLEQVTADMRVTLARIDERTESIEKHGATKANLAGGQLARRYHLPYRTSACNASNVVDAQSTYETQMALWGAVSLKSSTYTTRSAFTLGCQ